MEFESFDEGSFIHWNSEGETAPVDSIGIIGDEGEDVTALIAAKSEPKKQRLKPKIKRLQLHQKLTKEEKQHLQRLQQLYQRVVIVTMPD
jgi:pyruvate dehydrogenase E2 component (dihydrolipoamide acetyltransferase)